MKKVSGHWKMVVNGPSGVPVQKKPTFFHFVGMRVEDFLIYIASKANKENAMGSFKIVGDSLLIDAEGSNYTFRSMGHIMPQMRDDGSVFIDRPQKRYSNPKNLGYNRYCNEETEFTTFKIEGLPSSKGVYIWLIEGEEDLSYIGECVDFRKRFSPTGYGRISPRNCFIGGQSTNCKMNQEVLKKWKEGKVFHLYILETEKHKEIEEVLIRECHPILNKKNNSL